MLSSSFYKNPAFIPTPPLRFPQKLWKIANECHSGAVTWSEDGKSILLRYSLFKEEFMSTKNDFFKTDNISSFVRQLNLYGFRKIYDNACKQGSKTNLDLHEFSNVFFQRERPDLLEKVARKSAVLKDKNDFWPESVKSLDDSEESSYDKWEINNKSSELNDHSYQCSINENAEPYGPDKHSNIKQAYEDIDIVTRDQPGTSKENIPISLLQQTLQNNATLPVPKKKGRKPGSKNISPKPLSASGIVRPRYLTVTLKHPERYPELLHYKDDDDDDDEDRIFIRKTSRDVMWSSTQPFQETPEYRTLKETHDRQLELKKRFVAKYPHLKIVL